LKPTGNFTASFKRNGKHEEQNIPTRFCHTYCRHNLLDRHRERCYIHPLANTVHKPKEGIANLILARGVNLGVK
jgi:hypothetical protein